ncbi:hypothetical protein AVEN_150388-1 [Araneus ventricosus]|uniref:Uncharacterized protein n=1 Tax=Araneus ventricosus TaxID=182803 RepID=A0A4Y2TUR6_ARAVE|nr:hypothetical protein AVEN_150388-1 [Araneus ventricosus]
MLTASSSHGDFEACVNLLQTCFTLALLSCQIFCKLAHLQCKSAANLLQTKIAIWEECKLETSQRKLRSHHGTNLQQACRANSLQIIAKTEYEHNPG